jgi:hypothetical protein
VEPREGRSAVHVVRDLFELLAAGAVEETTLFFAADVTWLFGPDGRRGPAEVAGWFRAAGRRGVRVSPEAIEVRFRAPFVLAEYTLLHDEPPRARRVTDAILVERALVRRVVRITGPHDLP